MKKTTIYVDIDEDIAGIIEKLEAADEKIVALVLPKRPSVLQGSVNLQLLKKSADEASKNLVLITSDDQVLQLAGENGVHVSSSLQSKPAVPKFVATTALDDAIVEADDSVEPVTNTTNLAQPDVYDDTEKIDLTTPIGELANDEDMIELTDDADAVNTTEVTEKKASKKLIKVPNFNQFRTRLGLGIAGIVGLVAFLVWAIIFAPAATIAIRTEKSDVEAKLTLTAVTTATVVDTENGIIPAVRKEDKQKLTGTFAATGQKDVGEKASGTMTFRNCEDSDEITIPSGTGVSRGSLTFITQETVTIEGGTFSGGGSVCTSDASEAIRVVASQAGDQYNLAAGSYTVAGSFGNVRANGSSMGGGTTKVVKIVSQEDVETAKAVVLETAADNVKGKLSKLFSDEGLLAIEDTYATTESAPVSSIPVGQEATTDPTLTIELTSTMLGMKLSDVEPLLTSEVQKKIDTATQKVYETGASSARVSVVEKPNADTANITLVASADVGPNLDAGLIATEIAGKKAGEVKQLLEARPGVSSVDIDLSPFWVFSVPAKTSRITITTNE